MTHNDIAPTFAIGDTVAVTDPFNMHPAPADTYAVTSYTVTHYGVTYTCRPTERAYRGPAIVVGPRDIRRVFTTGDTVTVAGHGGVWTIRDTYVRDGAAWHVVARDHGYNVTRVPASDVTAATDIRRVFAIGDTVRVTLDGAIDRDVFTVCDTPDAAHVTVTCGHDVITVSTDDVTGA